MSRRRLADHPLAEFARDVMVDAKERFTPNTDPVARERAIEGLRMMVAGAVQVLEVVDGLLEDLEHDATGDDHPGSPESPGGYDDVLVESIHISGG